MTVTSFPLAWPAGWKRTAWDRRVVASFSKYGKPLTIAQGQTRVRDELVRLRVHGEDIIISSNLRRRIDGEPYSDQAQPPDPGAAVYWRAGEGAMRTMAIDRYNKVQDNLAAIAATLEAMRAIERHGGAVILDRAFAGFLALPAPGGSANTRSWREVLEAPANAFLMPDDLKALYRAAVSKADPNKPGGSSAAQAEINVAYQQAKQELDYA